MLLRASLDARKGDLKEVDRGSSAAAVGRLRIGQGSHKTGPRGSRYAD